MNQHGLCPCAPVFSPFFASVLGVWVHAPASGMTLIVKSSPASEPRRVDPPPPAALCLRSVKRGRVAQPLCTSRLNWRSPVRIQEGGTHGCPRRRGVGDPAGPEGTVRAIKSNSTLASGDNPGSRALLEGEGGHRGSPRAVAERSQGM